MNKPLVSVVMATFNEPVEHITASIRSILEQTYSNLELIIADDSTNESTIVAIDHLQKEDKRIILIRKNRRMGFVPALNEGLQTARGEYIARMDGDDIADLNRLQTQVNYLSSHKNIDILGGSMDIIDHNGNIISHRSYPSKGMSILLWTVMRSPLAHPTVMFRRVLVDSGYCYDESFPRAEDLEFWLRLRNAGFRIANTSQKLLNYRVVGDLATKRAGNNFKFNYKARLKNLSIRYLLFDVLSICIVKFYCLMPHKLISMVYATENK